MKAAGRRAKKDRLEEVADAFLGEAASPLPSRRLREYGLQRVLARAEAGGGGEDALLRRRSAHRNPALLRRVVLAALVVLLVLVASTGGAYAASLHAQPDSPLYGAKIFFERARIALSPSTTADVRLEMHFSDRRLQELEKMAASGSDAGSERWLREYLRNVTEAGDLIENMPPEKGEEVSMEFLETLDKHARAMEDLRHGQSGELAGRIERAYEACGEERERMRQRHGEGGQENPSPSPGPQPKGNGPSAQPPAGGTCSSPMRSETSPQGSRP